MKLAGLSMSANDTVFCGRGWCMVIGPLRISLYAVLGTVRGRGTAGMTGPATMTPGGRTEGGRRTMGLTSPVAMFCLERTDAAGECIPSRSDDLRLIDILGE